jgi:hypothetical protein
MDRDDTYWQCGDCDAINGDVDVELTLSMLPAEDFGPYDFPGDTWRDEMGRAA